MESNEGATENNGVAARVGSGQVGTPGQGPFMIVVVKAVHDVITQARFSTYGCPAANACGQCVCEAIEGKPAADAAHIDEEYITQSIGQMPLGREHCPGLATKALRIAIEQIGLQSD